MKYMHVQACHLSTAGHDSLCINIPECDTAALAPWWSGRASVLLIQVKD